MKLYTEEQVIQIMLYGKLIELPTKDGMDYILDRKNIIPIDFPCDINLNESEIYFFEDKSHIHNKRYQGIKWLIDAPMQDKYDSLNEIIKF